jgi:hypothetical protein
MRNTSLIMNEGIQCLVDKLGPVETEVFIAQIIHEPFDYTQWRRDNLYEDLSLHQLNQQAADYAKKHPFKITRKAESGRV